MIDQETITNIIADLIASSPDADAGFIEVGHAIDIVRRNAQYHLPTCDLRTDLLAGCSCGYWKDDEGNSIRFKPEPEPDRGMINPHAQKKRIKAED